VILVCLKTNICKPINQYNSATAVKKFHQLVLPSLFFQLASVEGKQKEQ